MTKLKSLRASVVLLGLIGFFFCGMGALAHADVGIEVIRCPDDGIQPRGLVDDGGTIHLIYYKREGENGDLFYVTRRADSLAWSERVRVNTEAGSVVPNGAIGMAQLALGERGRVHVSWFDMRGAKYWYTRLNDEGTAFEVQRNLVRRYNKGIEASAALAADGRGSVYMVWHAGPFSNESKRRIYVTQSADDGKTFSSARRANPGDSGSCACCGLAAITDGEGRLYISYRAAGKNVHRDMTLLESTDSARSFTERTIDRWELNACPVTITAFGRGAESGVVVAWETQGRSYLADVDNLSAASPVGPPPVSGRQKNPAVAVNGEGSVLIAWGVGEGWASGGRLHWQVFDADGKPTNQKGIGEREMPRSSVPAAVALADGGFVIIH